MSYLRQGDRKEVLTWVQIRSKVKANAGAVKNVCRDVAVNGQTSSSPSAVGMQFRLSRKTTWAKMFILSTLSNAPNSRKDDVMGALRPSMVKSCMVYVQNLRDYQIGEEKRACILEALEKQLSKEAVNIGRIGEKTRCDCPRCGGGILSPEIYCSSCGQKISWKVLE